MDAFSRSSISAALSDGIKPKCRGWNERDRVGSNWTCRSFRGNQNVHIPIYRLRSLGEKVAREVVVSGRLSKGNNSLSGRGIARVDQRQSERREKENAKNRQRPCSFPLYNRISSHVCNQCTCCLSASRVVYFIALLGSGSITRWRMPIGTLVYQSTRQVRKKMPSIAHGCYPIMNLVVHPWGSAIARKQPRQAAVRPCLEKRAVHIRSRRYRALSSHRPNKHVRLHQTLDRSTFFFCRRSLGNATCPASFLPFVASCVHVRTYVWFPHGTHARVIE